MKPFNRFITWTVPKASKLRKQKTSSINIIFTEIGWRLGLHNPRRISSRVRFQNSRIYRKKLFNAKRTGPKILKKNYNRGLSTYLPRIMIFFTIAHRGIFNFSYATSYSEKILFSSGFLTFSSNCLHFYILKGIVLKFWNIYHDWV